MSTITALATPDPGDGTWTAADLESDVLVLTRLFPTWACPGDADTPEAVAGSLLAHLDWTAQAVAS